MDQLRTPTKIRIQKKHWQIMFDDVQKRSPYEACGLVAGQGNLSMSVFPTKNVLHSPVSFRMDPKEQIELFLHFEKKSWELLAIYHSHPEGPPTPSTTDIKEAAYPEAVSMIWNGKTGLWSCRAFIIRASRFWEIPLQIVEQV